MASDQKHHKSCPLQDQPRHQFCYTAERGYWLVYADANRPYPANWDRYINPANDEVFVTVEDDGAGRYFLTHARDLKSRRYKSITAAILNLDDPVNRLNRSGALH